MMLLSFNIEGGKQGSLRAPHEAGSAVVMKKKQCEQSGCRKWPSYNFKGKEGGIFCAQHKQPGMVGVKAHLLK